MSGRSDARCVTEFDGGLTFTLRGSLSCAGSINASYPVMTEVSFECAQPTLPPGRYVTNVPPTVLVAPDDGGIPSCE